MFAITEVSLEDLSKIIREFKDFNKEGYVRKIPKHMPTDSYLYLARQLAKCAMINLRGPVRTQNMSTYIMSYSKISTQKIPSLHVCSTDKSRSKSIKADESEQKRVNVNVCSPNESKSKRVTIVACYTDES